MLTLAEFKIAKGESTDPSPNDDRYRAAIAAASALARKWTDRDFGIETITEARTYRYNGSGILEIDDASVINSVAWVNGATLPASSWYAMPHRAAQNDEAYTWLELPRLRLSGGGEMGFTRNEDTFLADRGRYAVDLTVNADWGWPVVPADVRRAVVWIAGAMAEREVAAGGGQLTSESIAEVARAWASEGVEGAGEAIPQAAQKVLDLYKRWTV